MSLVLYESDNRRLLKTSIHALVNYATTVAKKPWNQQLPRFSRDVFMSHKVAQASGGFYVFDTKAISASLLSLAS